jgi:hypothetical protein
MFIEMSDSETESNIKKRKFDVYKTGDVAIFDETRYFGYDIENIKNDGGIFSNDYMIFHCCGEDIRRWVGRKDYATLLDHLKKSHNMICVNCIEDDFKLNRVKISYKIKHVI